MGKNSTSLGRTVANTWRTITHDLFDTYRPERHYMRGPGPKWREKHGVAEPMAEPAPAMTGVAAVLAPARL